MLLYTDCIVPSATHAINYKTVHRICYSIIPSDYSKIKEVTITDHYIKSKQRISFKWKDLWLELRLPLAACTAWE